MLLISRFLEENSFLNDDGDGGDDDDGDGDDDDDVGGGFGEYELR